MTEVDTRVPRTLLKLSLPTALVRELDIVRGHLQDLDPDGLPYSREEVVSVLLLWLVDYKRVTGYAVPLEGQLALDQHADPLAPLWSEDDD